MILIEIHVRDNSHSPGNENSPSESLETIVILIKHGTFRTNFRLALQRADDQPQTLLYRFQISGLFSDHH
jgi:hypothetical protein